MLKQLKSCIILQVLLNLERILRLIINIFCAFSFLFFVKKPAFYATMPYSVLVWNILTMISQNPTQMIIATIGLIYPFYFIDLCQYKWLDIVNVYDYSITDKLISPFSKEVYFVLVSLITVYLFLILNSRKKQLFESYIKRLQRKNKVNDIKYLKTFNKIIDYICYRLNKIHRYIPIALAIFTALNFISIMNAILMIFALIFLWNTTLDEKYWRYFTGYVIFVIMVKQFGNYHLNIEKYNIEWLSLFGIVTVEKSDQDRETENRTVMIFNFFLVYFSCTWYLNIHKKAESTFETENPKAVKRGITSKLFKDYEFLHSVKAVYDLFVVLFQYYSIWIYHIFANILLISDSRDIFSVLLITCESVVCLIHISMWNRQGDHPYDRIYKVWIVKFYMVIFYAFSRYMMFFLKYQYVNETAVWFSGLLGIDGNKHLFVSINQIPKKELYTSVEFINLYYKPLMLLTIAVFTRETFLRILKKKSEEVRAPEIRKSILRRKTTHPDLDFNLDLSKMTRRTNAFVVCYMIFKNLFLAVVMQKFNLSMNIFKLFMLTCYLFNMRSLFSSFIDLCKRMRVMELFDLRIRYFHLTFLTSKKWTKDREEEEENSLNHFYTPKVQRIDLDQNKAYYEQFILHMEVILYKVNRVYWGLTVFPLILMVIFLMGINYFVPNIDREFMVRYGLNVIFGLSSKEWNDRASVDSSIIVIQVIIMGLLAEYMLTSYYFDCKNELKELKEADLRQLMTVLETKFKALLEIHTCSISKNANNFARVKDAIKKWYDQYKQALTFSPYELLNPTNKVVVKERRVDEDGNLMIIEKIDDFMHRTDNSSENSEEESSMEESDEEDESDDDLTRNQKESIKISERQRNGSDVSADHKKGKSVSKKGKKPAPVEKTFKIYFMTELITKEEMLLFLYKNKYKYYIMRAFESVLYVFTRVSILPILYPIIRQVNIFTIGFYIIFLKHCLEVKQTFLADVEKKINLVIAFLLIQTVHLYIHSYFVLDTTEPGVNKKGYAALVANMNPNLEKVLLPIESQYYSICYYWVFINSLGFSILPIFVWFSSKAIFREKLKKADVFHQYLFDQNRKRNIVIDYSKWKSSSLSFINSIYKYVYLNCMETHSFTILTCLILLYKGVYIWLFFFTMGLTINEHFKFNQIETESEKVFRDRRSKRILKIYMISYWVMVTVYHWIEFMGNLGFFSSYNTNKATFMLPYDAGLLTLCLLVCTGVFQDLIYSENYFEIFYKSKQESNLKVMYASLCKAYDINEKKIYSRIVEMMKKTSIDQVAAQVLDRKDMANTIIDSTYSEKCLLMVISHSFDWVMEKYISFFNRQKIRFMNSLYSFIIHKSDNYRPDDVLFLFRNVQIRNKALMPQEIVNLEEYFDSNMSYFKKSFDKVKNYYDLLRDGDPAATRQLDKAIEKHTNKNYNDNLNEFRQQFEAASENQKAKAVLPGFENAIFGRRGMKQAAKLENKPWDLLKLATDCILTAITTKSDMNSKSLIESFKLELKKRGSMTCHFGAMKIVLYNIKNDDIIKTKGYVTISFKTLLKYSKRVITTNSEYLVAAVLIWVNVRYGGCINILNMGIIIFTIFIEETSGRSFWWRILYSCYLVMVVCRRSYSIITYFQRNPLIISFVFGDMSVDHDIFCVILVMYTIEFLKKYGVGNKSAVDYENPGLAMARLTLNEDFEKMIDRICHEEVKKKEELNILLGSSMNCKENGIRLKDFKLILIRQIIKNYSLIRNFKISFLSYSKRLLLLMKFDYLKVGNKQLDNFFFRNFSKYLRKSGKHYTNALSSILFVIMLIYILMVFPTLSPPKTAIAAFLMNNSVTSLMVVNISVYLAFFLLHYYFDQMKSNDTQGLRSKPYVFSLMIKFDCSAPEKAKGSPLKKFIRFVSRIKHLVTFTKGTNEDTQKDYYDNPQFYHFLAMMAMWVYVNFMVYFWATQHGNHRSDSKKGIYKFLCQPEDKGIELQENNLNPCLSYNENRYTQVFYALNICYLITGMLQIKAGKPVHTSKIINFQKPLNKIVFKLFEIIPLVRETRVTFEYCATKTSLWFSDFILLKDLESLLQNAKMKFEGNMDSQTGKQVKRLLQNIICWVAILLFITVVAVPLFLFYNSSNDAFFDIDSAKLSVDLYLGETHKIVNLYTGSKLRINEDMKDSPDPVRRGNLNAIRDLPKIRSYKETQFVEIGFSKYSDTFLPLTPRLIEDIRYFIETNQDINIKTNFTFIVGLAHRDKSEAKHEQRNNHSIDRRVEEEPVSLAPDVRLRSQQQLEVFDCRHRDVSVQQAHGSLR